VSATLSAQVDQIGAGVAKVADLAEALAWAAVDLSEQWDHDPVHDLSRAAFKAQDAAGEVKAALSRLEEVAR
jgi:hypothetical protein